MSSQSDLSDFADRLRAYMRTAMQESDSSAAGALDRDGFSRLALELFGLQFERNAPYRRFCQSRGALPGSIARWTQIPAMPTSAFKEYEMSCLEPEERTRVFCSSGTMARLPSRHFHNRESLALYEDSLWLWFAAHLLGRGRFGKPSPRSHVASLPFLKQALGEGPPAPLSLTPPAALVPNSSLAHMFETVQRKMGYDKPVFLGTINSTGEWTIQFEAAVEALQRLGTANRPILLLGTAFSYVHLVDYLTARRIRLALPGGSSALETGGYKGRSRTVPKTELYSMISNCLGITADNIVGEYGMSELSSQAYGQAVCPHPKGEGERSDSGRQAATISTSVFRFPPWARPRVISPETGGEAVPGEAGLLQVFDLANVFSVMAVQTADVAICRDGSGFELLGRAASAEPRGCSLMAK